MNALFADLANPEPDAALFTGGCLRDAKAAWTGMQALFNSLGATLSVSPVEYRETASGRSALYWVAYRDRSFLSLISFDSQGRIAGFDTNPE